MREGKGREDERGHLLWPRQGINKQTGCQAISTHSEQTGRLTNLPHICGPEPGITQVRKVRCWNNTRLALMRLWSKSLQSYPYDNLFFLSVIRRSHTCFQFWTIAFMSQHHCPNWMTSPSEGRRQTSDQWGVYMLSIDCCFTESFTQSPLTNATSGIIHYGWLLLMTRDETYTCPNNIWK